MDVCGVAVEVALDVAEQERQRYVARQQRVPIGVAHAFLQIGFIQAVERLQNAFVRLVVFIGQKLAVEMACAVPGETGIEPVEEPFGKKFGQEGEEERPFQHNCHIRHHKPGRDAHVVKQLANGPGGIVAGMIKRFVGQTV